MNSGIEREGFPVPKLRAGAYCSSDAYLQCKSYTNFSCMLNLSTQYSDLLLDDCFRASYDEYKQLSSCVLHNDKLVIIIFYNELSIYLHFSFLIFSTFLINDSGIIPKGTEKKSLVKRLGGHLFGQYKVRLHFIYESEVHEAFCFLGPFLGAKK